ncbi:MAG: hypothetical protein GY803_22440 [Chloroflexi bacterium]|nr:hypothetical protein [Chloroflexota bacterium]
MKDEKPLSRRVEAIGIVLILGATAVLRMGWPGLTEFKADEARLLALALDMTQGDGLALRGISSSVGFPNFPTSVWIYALPLVIWPHLYAATLFTGLLNTLAAAAGYWFTRRYWGAKAALAATTLLAVSPWTVIFSRKIWAQNLLPLLVAGWGISAALTFVERRERFILLHFLCLALAAQTHLAAVALVPVTAVFLLIFRRRVNWKWIWVSGLLGLATAVPFFYYLWQNRAQAALPGGVGGGTVSLQALQLTATLSLGNNIHSLAGPNAFETYLTRIPGMTAVYWAWGALIIGGVGMTIYDLRFTIYARRNRQLATSDQRRAEAGFIVLLWLLGTPLFFVWHNTPIFLHYFVATLPAQYIAAGVLAARLFNGRRWVTALGWSALAATAVLQAWALIGLLVFLGQTATPGGFGTPVARQLEAVAQAKMTLAETNAAEILVVGSGESPRLEEFPAVYDVLLRDTPHRFVNGERSALFPAAPAVVLLADGMAVMDLYSETAVIHTEIPLRPGEGSLHVLALPANAAPAPDATFETPLLLANWVNLLGYDEPMSLGEETAVWQIHWRAGDNPDPANYQFFNHLLDSQGQRLSQADAAAFSPSQWRAGDVVVSRFVLAWPDGGERPYTIHTGMYRYPSLEPVPFLDVAGNPYAEYETIQIR